VYTARDSHVEDHGSLFHGFPAHEKKRNRSLKEVFVLGTILPISLFKNILPFGTIQSSELENRIQTSQGKEITVFRDSAFHQVMMDVLSPVKRLSFSTRLQDATSQKTVIFILAAMRIAGQQKQEEPVSIYSNLLHLAFLHY
jgi:hypothetical protein